MGEIRRVLQSLALAALVMTLCVLPAAAEKHEGTASFGLRPVRYDPNRPETASYFVFDTFPGAVIRDEVRVINNGSAKGTARLYAVDATTGQTGGTVFLSAADERQDVGAWTELGETEITLGPGEERIVSFSVIVPIDARPGQHVGGLVVEDVELKSGPSQGALQVKLQNRAAIALQINLPGSALEKVAITGVTSEVQQGYQMIVVDLRNEGNQMVKPSGSLVVTDRRGNEHREIPFQIDTFLPDTEIRYPIVVSGQALAAGEYGVMVRLSYGAGGTTELESILTISQEQADQVIGSVEQVPAAGATDGHGLAALVLAAGVVTSVVVGVGFVLLSVFRRHRRSASASAPASSAIPPGYVLVRQRPGTVKPLAPRRKDRPRDLEGELQR